MKDKELFEILEKHILEDKNPSEFLNYLKEKKLLEGSFLEILRDLEEEKIPSRRKCMDSYNASFR